MRLFQPSSATLPRPGFGFGATCRSFAGLGFVAVSVALVACSNDTTSGSGKDAGTGATGDGGQSSGGAGTAGNGGAHSGGAAGTAGIAAGAGGAGTGGIGTGGTAGTRGGAAGATNDGGPPADGGGAPDVDSGSRAPCSPPANVDAPIAKLSETGCMDAKDPTKLSSIVLPYEVNSPLWSDSADKTRGMRIPDGQKIHVKDCSMQSEACLGTADDGKWVLPVGTVMVKSFLFDGKLVETRLFVHFDATTWVGYSYQWDEAQTDATIVPDERRMVSFDTGKRKVDWNYPSRIDCMKCHNPYAGDTLGPETAQMNRVLGGKNQIDVWAAMGLFESTPAKLPPLVLPYAGQLGTPPAGATVEQRTRSYLHANCAFCHRPDGDFMPLDMRNGTPFKDMGLCNGVPQKGDVGIGNGAVDLKPKDPMHSVMWVRMHSLEDRVRMPQIATYQVDDEAVKLVGEWITGIQSCP
jgi:uncharacterized repeat protein (TIGR03806 family)